MSRCTVFLSCWEASCFIISCKEYVYFMEHIFSHYYYIFFLADIFKNSDPEYYVTSLICIFNHTFIHMSKFGKFELVNQVSRIFMNIQNSRYAMLFFLQIISIFHLCNTMCIDFERTFEIIQKCELNVSRSKDACQINFHWQAILFFIQI